MRHGLGSYSRIGLLYVGGLFLAFHQYLVIYINSSYLGKYVTEKEIGLLFVCAATVTIFFLWFLPYEFKHHGLYRTTKYLVITEVIALLGLSLATTRGLLIFFFILHLSLPALILYCMDIFLERETREHQTGFIRACYLTIMNIALVVSPLLTGLLAGYVSYRLVYLISAGLIIPLLSIMRLFERKENLHIIPTTLTTTIKEFHQDKNLRASVSLNFLLQFFYAVMVIYMPLYLLNHIGFSWASLGTVFTIMLLPFLIFELPLGWLADRKIGEKEILIVGFLILALGSMTIPFLHTKTIYLWAGLLFLTRVGASFVEIGSDTFFFKKVQAKNADLISFYRGMIPLSYICAPLLVSIALLYIPLGTIFGILGIVMLAGVLVASRIKDTR